MNERPARRRRQLAEGAAAREPGERHAEGPPPGRQRRGRSTHAGDREKAARGPSPPVPRTPMHPRAPNLRVHIGQAVPAELVEEALALEMVHDHGHELRISRAGARAARSARARASPRAGRRRRRLRLRRGRRRRGRRRLRLRVGGHGGGAGRVRAGRARGRAALRGGGGCTGPAARVRPTGCCYGTSGSTATPEVKGNRGKGAKGGDNRDGGAATEAAQGQFRPPPAQAHSRGSAAFGAAARSSVHDGLAFGPRGYPGGRDAGLVLGSCFTEQSRSIDLYNANRTWNCLF